MHRAILGHPVFSDAELFQLFTYCLIRVNFKKTKILFNSGELELDRGQFCTSRKTISRDLNHSEGKVERKLKTLQKLGIIDQQSYSKCRIISVINYEQYQQPDQQSISKRSASDQQAINKRSQDKNDLKNDLKKGRSKTAPTPPGFREGTKLYGDHVWLKPEEFERLVKKFGKEAVAKKIVSLDANIANGVRKYTQYKNHYKTINNWLTADLGTRNGSSSNGYRTISPAVWDMEGTAK